jgi:hypothetical protein
MRSANRPCVATGACAAIGPAQRPRARATHRHPALNPEPGTCWRVPPASATPTQVSTSSRAREYARLAALAASRARIVAVADTTRGRSERDLHDGAQQRLVTLGLHLEQCAADGAARGRRADRTTGRRRRGAGGVLDELREIARGLNPAALAQGGLRPALKASGRRSAVPTRLDVRVDGRLPRQIELAAHYVVKAPTNVTRHARVEALGGRRISIHSRPAWAPACRSSSHWAGDTRCRPESGENVRPLRRGVLDERDGRVGIRGGGERDEGGEITRLDRPADASSASTDVDVPQIH